MVRLLAIFSALSVGLSLVSAGVLTSAPTKTCHLRPLGHGRDDTTQIEKAIADCGHFGTTIFETGNYNVTRKMQWNLVSAKVELKGYLNFPPDREYWLKPENTYRVIFIQNQASWFVVTGNDFEIDAHNTGGIQGNGQPWWSYYATHLREDGDGRPVALTVWNATRGTIRNFRIESPPFWSNAVAQSSNIVYDGMFVNATNQDPLFAGQNIVWNTDGIDTYRSDKISLLNWDVTCGDDCLAFKGNSTNLVVRNITCRGGNGITFGSLGQYADLTDIVENVDMENLRMIRLDPSVQPNMANGVYFKSWDDSINGAPPTGGGAGPGFVKNAVARNVHLDRVSVPVWITQQNLAQPGDKPSIFKFSNLLFTNWTGTASTNTLVDLLCSPAVGCDDIAFENFHVTPPATEPPSFVCQNAHKVTGLAGSCNATGTA